MSSRLSSLRVVSGRPASSTACSSIYRFCSSSSFPLPPSLTRAPQPAATTTAAASSSSLNAGKGSAAHMNLDLGLNFETMDFEAIAKATTSAIARERGGSAAAMTATRERELVARLEKQAEHVASPAEAAPPPSASVPKAASAAPVSSETRNTPRVGGRGFGREGRPEQQQQSRQTGTAQAGRYSLRDLLRDCQIEGDWERAYKLFVNAVNLSCRQVLLPGRSATASADDGADAAREAECFAALKKMLAPLPPASVADEQASATRRQSFHNLRGVARWKGPHYYMLWRCLLEANRLDEVQRVWSVMQQIGFVDYAMEAKTVNLLMALLRHNSQQAQQASTQVVNAAVPHADAFDDAVERAKETRRSLVKELEHVATARHLHLAGANQRTAQSIRIAEALQRAESGDDGALGDGGDRDGISGESSAAGAESPLSDMSDSTIAVGDFNGLLRRSTSMASTTKILEMMAKLKLEHDATTFASLIASVHNPMYVLEGHTAEELAAHQSPTTQKSQQSSERSEEDSMEVNMDDTKLSYEAYKQERVDTALRWFLQCPQEQRTADVYNELLYLLRAKSHWRDFDKVLVEFRGNAVLREDEWPESSTAAPLLPPAWTTPPNGKTYELLVQRARYVHQWEVMWALYEEMTARRVRGTRRLYEVLLSEMRRHPPQRLHGAPIGATPKESSEALMKLYDELRRNGGDVRSLNGTMNVVDAWSKSRARANRWE